MTDTDMDFDFSGGYGATAGAEAAKEQGIRFDRPGYLSLDGSEAAVAAGKNTDIVRFLSDAAPVEANPIPWITVGMHSMVSTRPQPSDWPEGRKWPRSMGAVCRNDKVFNGKLSPCYIDNNIRREGGKPSRPYPKTWALAVRREEVLGTKEMADSGQIQSWQVGSAIGYRDRTKEVLVTDANGKVVEGETKVVPDIVIVQQAWKNFFSLLDGFYRVYHTVLDRDYLIARTGADQTTTYSIVPMEPIRKADGSVYDLRDPSIFSAKYPDLPDIRKYILSNADDYYFALYFDTTKPQPTKAERDAHSGVSFDPPAQAVKAEASKAAAPAAAAAPSHEPSQEQLAALKARVMGGMAPATAPAAEPAVADAPAAEAPAAAAAAEPAQAPAQPVATGPVAMD